MIEGVHHGLHCLFLFRREAHPAFKQPFKFRCYIHNLAFREKLRQRDAEGPTDSLQRIDTRLRVPLIYVLDGRHGHIAFLGKPILCPASLRQ